MREKAASMENAASIVSKFGQVLVEELQEIRGVGDKVVHLRDELASMNAVLRMLAEADEDCVDHLVREWTKQVRELASDAEDCVDVYKLRVDRPVPRPPVGPGTPLNSARRLLGHARLLPDIVRCVPAPAPPLSSSLIFFGEKKRKGMVLIIFFILANCSLQAPVREASLEAQSR